MDNLLKAFILSVGALFGVIEAGSSPDLSVWLRKDGGNLVAIVRLDNAVPPAAEKLVQTGNVLRIDIDFTRDGKAVRRVERTFQFDFALARYVVTGNDGMAVNSYYEFSEALPELTQFGRIAVEPLTPYAAVPEGDHVRLEVKASVRVNDSSGEDSASLWNYKNPSKVFKIRTVTEIPY
jgi:hypothetical protein